MTDPALYERIRKAKAFLQEQSGLSKLELGLMKLAELEGAPREVSQAAEACRCCFDYVTRLLTDAVEREEKGATHEHP